MTWRALWETDVWPNHDYADFATESAAETFAVAKSGEVGEEVAVIEVRDEEGL